VNFALNTIKSEHRELAAILRALGELVERVRRGSCPPDFAGLRAMLYYLDVFSARLHHPKEDEFLFQPLRARSGDAAALVDDLEREHACGAAAMRSLEQTLLRYEAGGEREFADFATAVEGFCDFYARHMHKEESLAMPLAEGLLSDEDWERIDAAFAAASEPRPGMDEDEELRQLFRRIVGPTPAAPVLQP
jgi:hemerythrin-like domain-containing protein